MAQKTLSTLRQLSVSEKEKIYRQYLGLVVDIAERYVNRSPGFTLEDLIGEGILGLFLAAEKFDEQMGYRFSTYATWWIKQSINRALTEHGKMIRIPLNMIEDLSKYAKVREKLWQELGREPLIEDVAAAMKITIKRAQQIRKFLENPSKIFSLEGLQKNDENSISPEFIEDPKVISPVELAFENIFKEDLPKTLQKTLTPREEKIIKMRFGLEDDIDHTLREIAKEMESNRETIRLTIKKALARLRREERRLKKES